MGAEARSSEKQLGGAEIISSKKQRSRNDDDEQVLGRRRRSMEDKEWKLGQQRVGAGKMTEEHGRQGAEARTTTSRSWEDDGGA